MVENMDTSQQPSPQQQKTNTHIERIFLITLNRNPQKDKQLVYMEDVAQGGSDTGLLDLEVLEQALFERILLGNPSEYLIPNDITTADTAQIAETKVILYLYGCFGRNEKPTENGDTVALENQRKMKALILRNACTSLKQPELYEGQNLVDQLLDIFKQTEPNDDQPTKAHFVSEIVREIFADADTEEEGYVTIRSIFGPMFVEVLKSLRTASLISIESWVMPFLHIFPSDKSNPRLAHIFLDYTTPPAGSDGLKYAESVLGQLLCLSMLPRTFDGPYEYYENALTMNRTACDNLSSSLWNYTKLHLEMMHGFVKSFLLLGGDVRTKMLDWIGTCLHANVARGQIWTHHGMGMFKSTAPDSFSINLAGVLLRLCQPLLKPQLKVLMVDPTYCSVRPDAAIKRSKGVHMHDTEKETCLLPPDENEQRLEADRYNFITECFFMTHKAIDLGYRVCIERFFRTNREVHRLQTIYNESILEHGPSMVNDIQAMISSQTQGLLCLQNILREPATDQLLLQFYEATAIWLLQLSTRDAERIDTLEPAKGFSPGTVEPVELPLPATVRVSRVLKSIPEYILENVVGYLQFSRQFDNQTLRVDIEAQKAIFTMVLLFMGSAERIRNPHLRARLAEGLESFLPKESEAAGFNFTAALFTNHPHRLEIIPNLLRVFVSIEMTGQSVQFEQKFNYRRPMYAIMDYLWKLDEQKQCFRALERQAIENIEAEDPPIFLRFINLLINDAIFLLDESLSNLQQIRQMQSAQDSGEWESLPQTERQQNQHSLRHMGMLARFDNILGRDTINMLQLLTSETKSIFCHSSMVDRVAAMLNYFLLNLTGPKKGNFKVKDKREFEFDPARTVLEICRIYVNLCECDVFCLAVSQDGRSYSPQLFVYAEQVLTRIGGGQLIGEIQEFSQKVQRIEKQQKIDEEALIDPPDEFLDPIMSSLMSDPVILPSSRITVDRSTIARHLLSDQSDPFNRSPLTMEQVKRNDQLKAEIEAWIREKRAVHAAQQANATAGPANAEEEPTASSDDQ